MVLLATGCAGSGAGAGTGPNPSSGETTLGDADDGREIALSTGQVLIVRLAGNPSTGYVWLVRDVDAAVLAGGAGEFTPSPAPTGMVGVGGEFTFRFTAVGTGTTQLALTYRRPWEDAPPARTFGVSVSVT